MIDLGITLSIPSDVISELQQYGNQIAKKLACTFRDELCREYQSSIGNFYASYAPRQYKRKNQLWNSYRPFYTFAHGTRYHGGVQITADGVGDVHHDSPAEVVSTAIAGFHGRPSLGIWTGPAIYDHIVQYRDLLFANCEAYV